MQNAEHDHAQLETRFARFFLRSASHPSLTASPAGFRRISNRNFRSTNFHAKTPSSRACRPLFLRSALVSKGAFTHSRRISRSPFRAA